MSASRTLALTLGDPAGIGPEVAARWIREESAAPGGLPAPILLVGSRGVFERAWREVGAPFDVPEIDPRRADERAPPVALFDPLAGPTEPPPFGRMSREGGAASHAWVLAAADLALHRRVAGVVTGPIHKGAWALARIASPGHTEALRDRAGVERVVMMLAGGTLRVALATIHVPLATVAGRLSTAGLLADLRIVDAALRGPFRIAAPRIAVCGLNPHAGEGGLLGSEDDAIVAPAVVRAREQGIDASGPHPADACIPRAAAGSYDAVLAMYHDQGLPAVKTFAPRHAVNVTLGLPFVRTSVDHGTAYDIAGRGLATASSLDVAVRLAASLASPSDTRRDAHDGHPLP